MKLSDSTREMARRFAALYAENWLRSKTPGGKAHCRAGFQFWFRAWKNGVTQ